MKNGWLKMTCMLLVSALLMNMLPMSVFAEEYRANLPEEPELSTQQTLQTDISNAQIVEEIVDKRTEYSKQFLLGNGLHMAAVYADAVHYEKDSGWAEIDNTLIAKTDGTYTNTAGVWSVSFPQMLSGAKSVSIEKDGYTLSFAMSGELRSAGEIMSTKAVAESEQFSVAGMQQSAATVIETDRSAMAEAYQYPQMIPEKQHSRLTYANVYQNTDVTYDLDSNTVKESIVMNAYSSTLRGYRYTLNVGDMLPELSEDGQITFYDAKKENVIMVMPAPYLMDAAHEYNGDIQVQLTGSGSTYTLTYLLPVQWLAAQEREWPVILDPVVTANLTRSNIRDCTVASQKTYDNNWGMNSCGYGSIAGIMRTYIKYENLPVLHSSDVVVDASISMYQADTPQTVTTVEAHKVNGTWASETITWANKPAHNNIIEDYATVDSNAWYTWSITDVVREWYANTNTGLVLKASDAIENGGAQNFKQFYSADFGTEASRPVLTIMFRNNNGLENYWDFTTMSVGRVGTGYINNYTGNLVFVHEDLGFSGNRMPVSISHIYNANDAGRNDFGMGYGWRTNYNQLVYQWPPDTSYYVWEDADGTKHYFKNVSSGKYEDEDGLELTLTVSGNNKIITDKNGNTSHFDSQGRLYKMENNQATKSSIQVAYQSSTDKRISTITDGAGRVYTFGYTSGNATRLSFKGKGSTELDYLVFAYSSEKLARVTYKDGSQANFYYIDNNLLQAAEDVDDYRVCFLYNVNEIGKPSRVRWTGEYQDRPATAGGGELNFEYSNNQTTITDHNGNKEIMQFNNWGNTISIQDDLGRAQYAKYATDESESGRGNQLRLSSKLQSTVTNLLPDSSFEEGTSWTNTNSTGVTNEVSQTYCYIGANSLKMVQSAAGTLCGVTSGSYQVAGGESYTFSAYVKTGEGINAKLAIQDNAGTVVYSNTLGVNRSWNRLEVTYTNSSTSARTITCRLLSDRAGTVYMDCVQLEKSITASRYNLVKNGDFSDGATNWYFTNIESDIVNATPACANLDNNAFRITGDPGKAKRVNQAITISGNAGDTFVLSGWAKGDSVSLKNSRAFGLILSFYYTDRTSDNHLISFNPDTDSDNNWQYLSGPIVAQKDYTIVYVRCVYYYNANEVLFDGIQLFREEFGSTYAYDADGNVTSVVDLQKKTTTYEYTNNNLTKEILPSGAVLNYTYDNYHNVKTATTAEGQIYSFAYDTYGNNTSVSITGSGKTITSTAAYTTDGNRLASTTDALGKVTTYNYDQNTNVLHSVKYPEDTDATKTNYTYDSMYRLASATVATGTGTTQSASYTYSGGKLATLTSGDTTYQLNYGDFGLRSSIYVGDRKLAGYTYVYEDLYLSTLDYGNGDGIEYTYDDFGRLVKETYEDGATVAYKYNNESNLATVTDSESGITTMYEYDFLGRARRYTERNGSNSHSVQYDYDSDNNLAATKENFNSTLYITSYAYDDDNRVTAVTNGSASKSYQYDAFGRNYYRRTNHDGSTIKQEWLSFTEPSSTATSGQVRNHRFSSAGFTKNYTYIYDDNGNLLSVSEGTNTASYVYDAANQIIRENNQIAGKTWTWQYDKAGNILQRNEYAYTTGTLGSVLDTVTYTYGDSSWHDLLTGYDGNTVTSDGIGNMLSDGTWSYTWKHGRQLASMTDGTNNWTFSYNADGLRTERTNGSTTYTYAYNGDKLSKMTVGSDVMVFSYDASGNPMSLQYNGVYYYYITNLQGDVIRMLDANGTLVAYYRYDAYGRPLSSGGPMVDINPLRYRGYIYDEETGLYYLQSRYYNPQMGRFINADGLVSTGQGILGNNMFAYCGNNPVSREDDGGEFWHIVIGAAVGAGIGIASKMITNAMSGNGLTEGLLTAGLAGALSGGLAASGVGLVGQVIGNAAIGMANNATDQIVNISNGTNTDGFDVGAMLLDGAIGAVAGLAGGSGAGSKNLTQIGATNLKRTANALTHRGVNAAKTVLTQGLTNFGKNAKHIIKPLAKSFVRATVAALGLQTAKILSFKERRLA